MTAVDAGRFEPNPIKAWGQVAILILFAVLGVTSSLTIPLG